MTDERYTFVEDVKEKKRTARGAHNKVTRGGRIKMPYDYLSRKEKKALNGDVKTFNMDAPMVWKEFKAMPADLQKEYIQGLIDKYGATQGLIAEMFGVTTHTIWDWGKHHGVMFRQGRKANKQAWDAFMVGQAKAITEDAEPPKATVQTAETKQSDITNIAALLSMLAGTGAKLTIEVTL